MGNCTAEQWNLSYASGATTISCLTPGETVGLAMVVESGFISMVSVIFVFVLIVRRVLWRGTLIQNSTDILILFLFIFDLIMGSGRAMGVKWVHEGKLYTGGYCTAQGVIQQVGSTGVALTTTAIAIHTLVVVLWGEFKYQRLVVYTTVATIWMFLLLFIPISVSIHTRASRLYETPVPYWCFIGDGNRYNLERFLGEYVWIWSALFVSVLAYVPLSFWARGNLTVGGQNWWRVKFHKQPKSSVEGFNDRRRKRRTIGMVAYPLAYSILVLPDTIVRFSSYQGHHIPPAATFAVQCLFSLSGAVNTLLFLLTRRDLFLPRNRTGKSITKTGGNNLNFGLLPEITAINAFTAPSSKESLEVGMPCGAAGRPMLRSRGDEPAPLGVLPGADLDLGGWTLEAGLNQRSDMTLSNDC